MGADGLYREGAATQHGAAAAGLALIADAVDGVAIGPEGAPLLLADLGAADGSNSLEPIRRALAAVRRRAPRRPVLVVHADIPGNDFGALAQTLERAPDRYALGDEHVLPLMAARSLYERVLPAGALAFGWTASTLHWLSRAPGPVDGHFFVQLSQDGAARERFAAQSAQDWHAFLAARATELTPGASVVIVDVLMGDDGSMGSEALFDALDASIERCRAEGLVSAGERERIVYPTWFRSLEELRAPFAPHVAGPGGERLELVEVRPVQEPDPFADRLGDPPAYAAAQVAFLRGFLEPSFTAALAPGRDAASRASVLDAIWSAAGDAIAADPQAVSPTYRLVALRIRRTA